MQIDLNLWPNGAQKALTLSYDDGQVFDERLAKIFDDHQMKATFHLVSDWLDSDGFLTSAQVRAISERHEISAHCRTHPYLTQMPAAMALADALDCKRALEEITGGVVRGMSYPYGAVSDEVVALMRACGMEYSRTVWAEADFHVPTDFLMWRPTCHHSQIGDSLERFLARGYSREPLLYYLWGHSFEFDRNQDWDVIERFCDQAAGKQDVWYATNVEIVTYIQAVRALRVSADGRTFFNSSCTDVLASVDGQPVCLPAGKLTKV